MTDILNPLNPRNPSQQVGNENAKVPSETNEIKKVYHENSEGVFLPSKGLFYSMKYHKMEILKVRPLDYTDEDILTTESYYTNGTIFTELLNNVIVDENNFKANSLVPVDRDTILIWLRSTAFGNIFEIEYQCPTCKAGKGDGKNNGNIVWDLNSFAIPEYEEEVLQQFETNGYYEVETPLLNLKVRLVSPSLGESTQLEKNYQQKKKDQKTKRDFFATTTLLSIVSGVEVEEGKWIYDKSQIQSHFHRIRLPISDSRYLLNASKKLNLKYNTKQNFICKDCGYIEEDVEMPILHRNFFWPDFQS